MSEQTPAVESADRRYVPWYKRLIRSRRALAMVLLLTLLGPVSVRWYRLWWLPDIPVPFDVADFTQVPADEENAYYYFTQAVIHYNGMTGERDFQPVLELFRQGANCPTASYIRPDQYTVTTNLNVVQGMRDLQRLVVAESYRRMYENRAVAVETLHDGFRASRHLGHHGSAIERLVGIACHAIILPAWEAWSQQPEVTAEELEAALERLQRDFQLTPRPSEIFQAEYFMHVNETKLPMAFFRDAFDLHVDRISTQRFGFSTKPTTSTLNKSVPGWQIPVMWAVGEPALTHRATKLWLRHELDSCDLPFPERPEELSTSIGLFDAPVSGLTLSAAELDRRLSETLFHEICPAMKQVLAAVRREASRQVLLETQLQLQARYRWSHAASQAEAERQLVDFPWPADPCSKSAEPIHFRVTDKGLRLWSIGQDGVDQQDLPAGQDRPPNNQIDDIVVTIPWPKGTLEKTTEQKNGSEP